jgi:molybdopterin molybdotransferase
VTPAPLAFEEAERIVLAAVPRLEAEEVDLDQSLGRVLAYDVRSDVDMPPFDKAAMDGFACRLTDAEGEVEVVAEIPTGTWPGKRIADGQCARIMTGAPLPAGAETVVMMEQSEACGQGRVHLRGGGAAANICWRGEDVQIGQVVLGAGRAIGPAQIAVLAAVGCVRPKVARRPRVGVIVTGSELVEPYRRPGPAQIRNSNGQQLCAQVQRTGACAHDYGIVPDHEQLIEEMAARALADSDLVIFSGGVSVGAYDFVPQVLLRIGVEVLFHGVNMQPGKPTLFGRRGQTLCCGLPGNPVATLVVFELLLRPLLLRMMGAAIEPRLVPAVLATDFARKKSERQATVPVRFDAHGAVAPIEYHGAAHISAISQADALLVVPAGTKDLAAGSKVHVRPL